MWNRRLQTSHFLAFVASATSVSSTRTQTTAAFTSPAFRRLCSPPQLNRIVPQTPASIVSRRETITQQYMSFFDGPAEGGIRRIGRPAMTEIIEDVVNSSREESGYVIIDVRGQDEIQYTGKLDDVVETLPLPYIANGALSMEEEEFKESFGFEKPGLDETLVFTCKAGIRSQSAGQLAKMAVS
mmetsp:Transcript_3027/g.6629  ORF Transcript_3027/g.6629 Transcript_3027/m.6629 type:complete len:184 (-) Transcript_3027:6-557(-)